MNAREKYENSADAKHAGGEPRKASRRFDDMDAIKSAMTELYDHYFSSRGYQERYPQPNRSTLEFLLLHGAARARRILDYGCGNGRYALPLMEQSSAHLVCYDVSAAAIQELACCLAARGLSERATLLYGDDRQLEHYESYDVILLLFGVLSHIGDRLARIASLTRIRRLIEPDGKLILTVPNSLRRRPLDLLHAEVDRLLGRAEGVLMESGNIAFTRRIDGMPRRFFYHLYSIHGLEQELKEAGFSLVALAPESILPEWAVTQSDLLGWLDAALLRFWPAVLGYGMCAVAVPA